MITLLQSPVSSDPEVMGGTLVFKNTIVPAQSLLEYLDDGFSLNEFLENFPLVDWDNKTWEILTLFKRINS